MSYASFPTKSINFSSVSSFFIYEFELSGQISDGKYENSRPYDHWQWVSYENMKITINPEAMLGYTGYEHKIKTYNLNEWLSAIKGTKKDASDWQWAERIMAYGRLGKVVEKLNIDFKTVSSYDSSIVELAYFELKKNPELTFEMFKEKCINFYADYLNKSIMDEKVFNEFKNMEYSFDELKKDHENLKKSVNKYLGWN